jgi:hypothetical protein
MVQLRLMDDDGGSSANRCRGLQCFLLSGGWAKSCLVHRYHLSSNVESPGVHHLQVRTKKRVVTVPYVLQIKSPVRPGRPSVSPLPDRLISRPMASGTIETSAVTTFLLSPKASAKRCG